MGRVDSCATVLLGYKATTTTDSARRRTTAQADSPQVTHYNNGSALHCDRTPSRKSQPPAPQRSRVKHTSRDCNLVDAMASDGPRRWLEEDLPTHTHTQTHTHRHTHTHTRTHTSNAQKCHAQRGGPQLRKQEYQTTSACPRPSLPHQAKQRKCTKRTIALLFITVMQVPSGNSHRGLLGPKL